MASCVHDRIEFRDEQDESMHCWGWVCLSCDYLATGECHHRTWCRVDFCGAQPVGFSGRQACLAEV